MKDKRGRENIRIRGLRHEASNEDDRRRSLLDPTNASALARITHRHAGSQ